MLRLTGLSKAYPTKTILDEVDWHVGPGQRWGLVGANGAGKSTLIKIVLGELDADSGKAVLRSGAHLGHLAQELLGQPGQTLQEGMAEAFPEVLAAKAQLIELEAKLATTHDAARLEALVHEQAEVQAAFERAGGYTMDARIGKVLHGLGFSEGDRHKELAHFSGGWRMRAALARLLLAEPDLLLLDEPTNHLDLDAIRWLEGHLAGYPGALILISHDRAFLDAATQRTAFLENGRLYPYPFPVTQAEKKREAEAEAQAAAYQRQQGEIARLQSFVDRFRASATRSTQAKSREKFLAKLERIEAPSGPQASVKFRFGAAPPPGRVVLSLNGLAHGYGGKTLFHIGRLEIERGMRVALMGPNGTGKSTLLRLLAGIEAPNAGEAVPGLRVNPGHFAQDQADSLDPESTVLEEVWSVDESRPLTQVRTLLGCLLFRGEDVMKPVSALSGGERGRLALAKLLMRPHNLLLLDEPTNHLDMPAKAELAEALAEWDGSTVVISHDRDFLNAFATHVLHLDEGGEWSWHVGGIPSFLEFLDAKRLAARSEAKAEAAKLEAQAKAEVAGKPAAAGTKAPFNRYKAERELEAAEAALLALEEELEGLRATLADPATYREAGNRATELQARLTELEGQLPAANERWEAAASVLA